MVGESQDNSAPLVSGWGDKKVNPTSTIDESGLHKVPDVAKLLDLYNSQTATVNTLWNIFIGVNLAIIGFLYKDSGLGKDWKIKIGFTVGFFFFSFANRNAILRSHKILYAISKFLSDLSKEASPEIGPILLAHETVSPNKIRNGHLIFTVLVALVIWSPEIQKIFQRY